MTSKKHSSRISDGSTERSDIEEKLQNLAVHIAEERFKPGQGDFVWLNVNFPVMKDGRSWLGRNIVHLEPDIDKYRAVPLDEELDIWITHTGVIVERTRPTSVLPIYETIEFSQRHDEELHKLHARAEALFDRSSGGWRIAAPITRR